MGFFDFLSDVLETAGHVVEQQESRINGERRKLERNLEHLERTGQATAKQKAALDKLRVEPSYSSVSTSTGKKRRTDAEIESTGNEFGLEPDDYECAEDVPLSEAADWADNEPGVYVLYLNGRVMKCGRAAYSQGVRWRFRQYYNLNYDSRAQHGDHWSINEENRDSVMVSWQCCPEAYCSELEYKLFRKYGKGPWAQRAPASCHTDKWKLLI